MVNMNASDVKIALSRPIIPKVIFFILVFILVWQIINAVFSLFSIDKIYSTHQNLKGEIRVKSKQALLTVGLNTAFFGDYVPNLNDAEVKQSMLDLTVVGIMFDNHEKLSHVIIRTAGGREQTFGVGDSLPGGAVIKRITPDGVLIRRNGSLERLNLPKSGLTFEPPAKPLKNSD